MDRQNAVSRDTAAVSNAALPLIQSSLWWETVPPHCLCNAKALSHSRAPNGQLLERSWAEAVQYVLITLLMIPWSVMLSPVYPSQVQDWTGLAVYSGQILLVIGLLNRRAQTVMVGADGVLIKEGVESRFISYAHMQQAEILQGVYVRVTLRSGEQLYLYGGEDCPTASPYREGPTKELARRIHWGIVDFENPPSLGLSPPLADGLRWQARSALGHGPSAPLAVYRSLPSVPRDTLWALVESPSIEPPLRAAAAVVLGRQSSVQTQRRLRAASEVTVHPALRQVLRLAARRTERRALRQAFEALDSLAVLQA